MPSNRFYSLATYFRQRFDHRIQKIPLDVAGTCPNRDGTLSRKGCSFCNQKGSGTGLSRQGHELTQQYLLLCRNYQRRMNNVRFLAYAQSFSNTHGPAAKLARLVDEIAALPDQAGMAIGTRPDCLDEEKLDILAGAPLEEVWLDLGLQSAHDATLNRINRGHSAECFAIWTRHAAARGLKVCAHVMIGLPGENMADFEQTVLFVNSLPVTGIKIHNLFIARGTHMESQWRQGTIALLSRRESLDWAVRGLELLRPDIVVHRLIADPVGDELIAPGWAQNKHATLDAIRQRLEQENSWQGRALDHSLPPWLNI